MNKNKLALLGIAAVVIAGLGVVVLAMQSGKKNDTNGTTSTSSSNSSYTIVTACKALTLADAQAILGANAKAGSTNSTGDTSSDDVNVSTCTYSASGSSVTDISTISLLARSAKTAAGAASNHAVFTTNKPAGMQDVANVGDMAYWNASLSQLNILKGNNWYIIGNIAGTHADSGSLDTAKATASRIMSRL